MVDFKLLRDEEDWDQDQQLYLKAIIAHVDADLQVRVSKISEHLFLKSMAFQTCGGDGKFASKELNGDALKQKFQLWAFDGSVVSSMVGTSDTTITVQVGRQNHAVVGFRQPKTVYAVSGQVEVEGQIFHSQISVLGERSLVFRQKLKYAPRENRE